MAAEGMKAGTAALRGLGLCALAAAAAVVTPLRSFAAGPRELYDSAKDKIVIVQCDGRSGSGFVCELDGAKYLVTCRSAIEGRKRVAAFFPDGRSLGFYGLEIARNGMDLARFLVETNQPALKPASSAAAMRQRVFVFGDVGGNGVLKGVSGAITGIGPGRIEISASIDRGCGGGAVLDENGDVLGVAAPEAREYSPKDWEWKGSGAFGAGRCALALANVAWKKTDLNALAREAAAMREAQLRKNGIFPQAKATFRAPSLRVNRHDAGGDPSYWINGNIVLSLSAAKDVKNPVVRVVTLVDCGDGKIVMDAVATKPKGMYEHSGVPVFASGMESSGRSFDAGGKSVCFLEALSYYQNVISPANAKNLEYFDRKTLLRGGFRIPDKMVGSQAVPKIVAFRFECWQNGCLAGAYDSLRPDTLEGRGIPADWHVAGRHPQLFKYCETRYEEGRR